MKEAFVRVEGNNHDLTVNSDAKKELLNALLISLVFTVLVASTFCFVNRRLFFPGRHIIHDLLLISCQT